MRAGSKRRIAAWAVHWHAPRPRADSKLQSLLVPEARVLSCDPSLHTNQRAELEATLRAVEAANEISCKIHRPVSLLVRSDSKWVQNGFTDWMPRLWKKNAWKTSTKKLVKHADLWKALDAEAARLSSFRIEFVKGHSGDVGNDAADDFACRAIACFRDKQQN